MISLHNLAKDLFAGATDLTPASPVADAGFASHLDELLANAPELDAVAATETIGKTLPVALPNGGILPVAPSPNETKSTRPDTTAVTPEPATLADALTPPAENAPSTPSDLPRPEPSATVLPITPGALPPVVTTITPERAETPLASHTFQAPLHQPPAVPTGSASTRASMVVASFAGPTPEPTKGEPERSLRAALPAASIQEAVSAGPVAITVSTQTSSSPSAQPSRLEATTAPNPHTQPLERIVEHLSAAREAATPATAVIRIEHQDFGDLSLRFNQGRGGALAVQIAASDAEMQQAMVLSAGQAGTPSQNDNRASHGGYNSSRAHTASDGGSFGESEHSGRHAPHEHDRDQSQRKPRPHLPAAAGRKASSGIFA